MMQTYLLAANLFALTALLLGLYDFSRGHHSWRLLPLFFLVISRSFGLIFALQTTDGNQTTMLNFIAATEVFSTLFVVWVLTDLFTLPPLGQRLVWLGGGISLFFALMPIFPDWPLPYQLHSLIIAILGAPLIFVSLGQISWIHLAPPLILALANFFSLLELNSIFQLMTLLAYGAVIGALHWEGLQTYRGWQQESQAIAEDAIYLSQARQRMLEVSEIISAVPSMAKSMEHVARSMAHITHSDQSVIFLVDTEAKNELRPAAIYSPEHPVEEQDYQNIAIDVTGSPPLQVAFEQQEQQFLPAQSAANHLSSVYALWYEIRTGPLLIQPLSVQGRPVGALILGNPVTKRPIQVDDQTLCHSLASQIAVMVEAYRQSLPMRQQVDPASQPQPDRKLAVERVAESVPAAETVTTPQPRPIPEPVEPAPLPVDKVPALGEPATTEPESEESKNYLAVIEAVQQGVVVSDGRGRVQLINQAAERILGKPRQQLLGQPIGTIYGEISSGESIEELAAAFSRRNEPLPTFFENDERAIQGQLIPWRNAEQEWLGMIAVFSDVTRQVRADRARNDFISALSRTLRSPLTLIKGYAELIINGALGDYSPDQLQVLRVIHTSAERVSNVLDNAIQINAENRRQILPKFEEVDVEGVINAAFHEVAPLADLRAIVLTKEIKTELPHVVADRKHLHTILENLLSNACRFTPSGGQVTLQTWVQEKREHNTKRPYLQLAVSDNGPGISKMEQKRIFDPFYQLENEDSGVESGLGMGLTVVKELVELHNGAVWVESTPGSGSIFQVSLPVSQSSVISSQ